LYHWSSAIFTNISKTLTESTFDLSSFAPHEQVNSMVLVGQDGEQRVFELEEFAIAAARD